MTPKITEWTRPLIAAAASLLLAVAPVGAQDTGAQSPLSDFLISGYGTVNYSSIVNHAGPQNDFAHDFSASLSPVVLFSMSDDLMLEAEFEFSFEGESTATSIEYTQINYLGFENVQLTAGKFLLPFGLFSERLHPSWINKMPSMPLLYGHAHGGVTDRAMLPVLSDVGLMGRLALPLGERLSLNASAYVTQGPALESGDTAGTDGGHAHAVRGGAGPLATAAEGPQTAASISLPSGATIPGVSFGANFSDNNDNKMLGARVGLVSGGNFELHVSGFHAMTDPGDFQDLKAGNLAVEWRPGPFELRGEGILMSQEFVLADVSYETLERSGYYLQASRRFGAIEPVVRWSSLGEATFDGTTARGVDRQLALGAAYWITPSVPVKAAFEWNLEQQERVLVQWAYGF